MSAIKTQILHDYLHSQLAIQTDVKKVPPKVQLTGHKGEMFTREQLIYALYQAAELEHSLMMQYLFTAYTIKDFPEEYDTHDDYVKATTWKSNILYIAQQEMLHLGLVLSMEISVKFLMCRYFKCSGSNCAFF